MSDLEFLQDRCPECGHVWWYLDKHPCRKCARHPVVKLLHKFHLWVGNLDWHYVEFHGQHHGECHPARRRFTDPAKAVALADLLKSERGHRCKDSVKTFSSNEFLQNEGWFTLSGQRGSEEFHAKLMALTNYGPNWIDDPYAPRYPPVEHSRQPRTIARLQWLLDRVATRTGGIGTKYGVLYRYAIPIRRPMNASWPRLQSRWSLVFWPLCWLNDQLVNRACRRV